MAKVIKTMAEMYRIRHKSSGDWGDIFVTWGEESVRLTAHTPYGSYSCVWSCCGGNPKQFLTELDFDYCLKKLTDYKHYMPDPSRYPFEIKQSIIQGRRDRDLTKKEARTAWKEMLNTEYDEGELFFNELTQNDLFEKVFGATEYLPSAQKIKPECQLFWDMVWLPFVAQLREELAND